MKKANFGKTILCLIIGVGLFSAGVLFGAYKGWNNEHATLTTLAEQTNSINQLLQVQGADISNLLVVAKRHLPKNSEVFSALEESKKTLTNASSLQEKHGAYWDLSDYVARVSTLLQATPSFQNSPRDQVYLSTLEKDLAYLTTSIRSSSYNQAALDHNLRFSSSLSGKIAGLLGVKEAPVFQ